MGSLTEVASNDDVSPGVPWSEVTFPVSAGVTYQVAVDGRLGTSGAVTLGFTWSPDVPPVPGAPTGVSAVAGNASAVVSWTPPPDGSSSIISYDVTAYIGTAPVQTTPVAAPAATATITGLTNGVAYTFTVAATTADGAGPASAPSGPITPHTVPDAPIGVAALPGDASAIVSWSPPTSNGGAPITSYTVTAYAGPIAVQSKVVHPVTAAILPDLVNGTAYTFTVAATNAAGTGVPSAFSNEVIPVVPAPPPIPPLPTPPVANNPPVAADDSYQVKTGEALTVPPAGVLANDGDSDGDVLGATLVAPPVHGTLFLAVDGSFLYTPAPGWAGIDVFTYRVQDFLGGADEAVVRVTASAVAGLTLAKGYWLVASDGGIFAFGDATFQGSTGSIRLNRPIVGVAATPGGRGYWLVASDGEIFTFGDAGFHGSTGGVVLNRPIVGMASTPSGLGYWLVASDGGIFAFGDAAFHGSTGSIRLNRPIVGMVATPGGRGYWLVASDGGIFAFGDAIFYGSTGGVVLNRPIVGMVATPGGRGYWLVASDGGIFTFGDASFLGSSGASVLNRPIIAMAALR